MSTADTLPAQDERIHTSGKRAAEIDDLIAGINPHEHFLRCDLNGEITVVRKRWKNVASNSNE